MNDWQRQYTREDIDYETWYSPIHKHYARTYTKGELEKMLASAKGESHKASESHLKTLEKTSSMASNSQGRAHARNTVATNGQKVLDIEGAIEIHELFPEKAKSED